MKAFIVALCLLSCISCFSPLREIVGSCANKPDIKGGYYNGSKQLPFATFFYTVNFDGKNMYTCVKVEGSIKVDAHKCSSDYTFDESSCEIKWVKGDCLDKISHSYTDNFLDSVGYDSASDVVVIKTHSPHTPGMENLDWNLTHSDAEGFECGAPEVLQLPEIM